MIIVGILAVGALVIFYWMSRSSMKRRNDHTERLERHRQYFDALMERRNKADKEEHKED
jgi:hypothetical protein